MCAASRSFRSTAHRGIVANCDRRCDRICCPASPRRAPGSSSATSRIAARSSATPILWRRWPMRSGAAQALTRSSRWRGGPKFRTIRTIRFADARSIRCTSTCAIDSTRLRCWPRLRCGALVSGETEIADPDTRYVVETSEGRRIPVAIDAAREARAIDNDIPAAEFKSIVGSLSQPSIFGRTVNRYEITTAVDGRPQVNLFMSRAAFSDIDLEDFRHAIRTRIADSGSVRIHATSAARCNVSFVANDLSQTGFSFYRLIRDDSAAAPANRDPVAPIENEFFRLTPTPRGLEIRDLTRNASMELYFEDDGDRGDEYNFDPVGDGSSIANPASISASVLENGPVRKRIKLSM